MKYVMRTSGKMKYVDKAVSQTDHYAFELNWEKNSHIETDNLATSKIRN